MHACLSVLGPLVLLLDLRLLLRREVVDDVEAASGRGRAGCTRSAASPRGRRGRKRGDAQLPDLLGLLALDHVGDRLAPDVTASGKRWRTRRADGCEVSARTSGRASEGRGGGGDAQEGLDVEVVGGEDDLEEHLLVYIDELLVPVGDLCRLLA